MEKLTEMMQFRDELTKRYSDLNDAKEAYKFITCGLPLMNIEGSTKSSTEAPYIGAIVQEHIADGVYYIYADGKYVIANEENAKDGELIVAVGVKLGNRHAAIAMRDLQGGDDDHEYPLCNDSYTEKKSGGVYYDREYKAISDMDGKKNTEALISSGIINQAIVDDMKPGEYIPACGELHLMVLFLDEVNNALRMAGGQELAGSHWSSSEYNFGNSWRVGFNDGLTYGTYKGNNFLAVRPAVAWTL